MLLHKQNTYDVVNFLSSPPQKLLQRMMNRRNIRIKVMQVLYMLATQQDDYGKKEAIKTLHMHFEESKRLFIYLIHFLIRVGLHAQAYARTRASKHVLTNDDRNVNTKITGNMLLLQMLNNPSFQEICDKQTLDFEDTYDYVRKIYQNLTASQPYHKYITNTERRKNNETDIIKYIFTDLLLPDENFIAHIEEHFINWDDDADLMNQLILYYLQKPESYNLQQLISEEKWEFAKNLLQTVIDKKEILTALIKPRLKNWDSERLALLDMILMHMGVCEFLYFETIPPKVTINEYIDLAKEYSTQQSGQFVNGILDNIHKELIAENKLQKISFK